MGNDVLHHMLQMRRDNKWVDMFHSRGFITLGCCCCSWSNQWVFNRSDLVNMLKTIKGSREVVPTTEMRAQQSGQNDPPVDQYMWTTAHDTLIRTKMYIMDEENAGSLPCGKSNHTGMKT